MISVHLQLQRFLCLQTTFTFFVWPYEHWQEKPLDKMITSSSPAVIFYHPVACAEMKNILSCLGFFLPTKQDHGLFSLKWCFSLKTGITFCCLLRLRRTIGRISQTDFGTIKTQLIQTLGALPVQGTGSDSPEEEACELLPK